MITLPLIGALRAWHLVTRLGEAQVVLPLAAVGALTAPRPAGRALPPIWWVAPLAVAALVTFATKIAFIGWGIGSAELDFTGISGHAMLAAAVYPVLLAAMSGGAPRVKRGVAIAVGGLLAFAIGISRLVLDAHSLSEVMAGWLVGGAAAAAVLARGTPAPLRMAAAVPAFMAMGLLAVFVALPALNTQRIVTRAALAISGHERPYTRRALACEGRCPPTGRGPLRAVP